MNWEIILKPCPWCFKTPEAYLSLEMETGGTWVWSIFCANYECAYKPTGRKIAIRKGQRYDLKAMERKLNMIVSMWNAHESPHPPYEKVRVPLDEWEKWIKKHPQNATSLIEYKMV